MLRNIRFLKLLCLLGAGFILSACSNNFTVDSSLMNNFKITNLKSGNAEITLSWIRIPGVLDYTIYYRQMGSDEWSSFSATKPPVLVSGLVNGVEYEFKVEAAGAKGTNISDVRTGIPFAKSAAYVELVSSSNRNIVTPGRQYRVDAQLGPPTNMSSGTTPKGYKVYMNFAGIYESEEVKPLNVN